MRGQKEAEADVEQQPLLKSTATTAPEIQQAGSPHRGAACCSSAAAAGASGGSPCHSQHGADSQGGESILGTCRICFESETADSLDTANPLICPCLCSGGSKHVHRQCLERWRNTNHRQDAFYQCEVCKFRYQYRRLWWANLLGSPATLAVVFVLCISTLIFALGFIPVLNNWSSSSSSSSSGGEGGGGSSPAPGGGGGSPAAAASPLGRVVLHIANGVVMLGLLGLAASLALLVARACGATGVLLLPDPCCPGCMLCLDLSGGGGSGWPLLLECGSAGECGIIVFGVAAVVLVVVGIVMACYLVYGLLWMVVHLALGRAQQLVENVQPQQAQQQHHK